MALEELDLRLDQEGIPTLPLRHVSYSVPHTLAHLLQVQGIVHLDNHPNSTLCRNLYMLLVELYISVTHLLLVVVCQYPQIYHQGHVSWYKCEYTLLLPYAFPPAICIPIHLHQLHEF